MKHSVFKYHCEKYSIRDINSFIEKKGYTTQIVDEREANGFLYFSIPSLAIHITLPEHERLNDPNPAIWKTGGPPGIKWFPINDLYSQKCSAIESGDPQRIKASTEAYEKWHKEASRLYSQLKRKFGIKGIKTLHDVEEAIKKGEYPMSIKDLDYIEELRKNGTKKTGSFGRNKKSTLK